MQFQVFFSDRQILPWLRKSDRLELRIYLQSQKLDWVCRGNLMRSGIL
ncbi:MAG: hypothetical protein AAF378_21070 [Cyanobacteria bacterium P01_A01_bin.84]